MSKFRVNDIIRYKENHDFILQILKIEPDYVYTSTRYGNSLLFTPDYIESHFELNRSSILAKALGL